MTRQTTRDRDHAIRTMTRLGITPHDQARLLRLGATLHRLAEAECNGDYPCDNGERGVLACGTNSTPQLMRVGDRSVWGHDGHRESKGCGSMYVPSALRSTRGYLCPACCAEEDAQKIAATYGLRAIINGDPRGMVLGLVVKDASFQGVDSGRVRPEYVR